MTRLSTIAGIASLTLVLSGCPLSDHFYFAEEAAIAGAAQNSRVVSAQGGERGGLGGQRATDGGSQSMTAVFPQPELPSESGGSDAAGGADGIGGAEAAGGALDSEIGGADSSGGFGNAFGSLEAGANGELTSGGTQSTGIQSEGGGRSNLGAGGRADSSSLGIAGRVDAGSPGTAGRADSGPAAPAGASGAGANLIDNPGFENGIQGWSVFGVGATAMLAASSDYAHGGSQSLLTSWRSSVNEGPAYSLTGLVTPGDRYRVQLWLRLVNNNPYPSIFYATVRTRCKDGTESYRRLATSTTATSTRWTELSGVGAIAACGRSTATEISLYVESSLELSFYIDDVVFVRG